MIKVKKMIVFLMMVLFCVSAFPAQDQLQKRFSFSLSGGIIGRKFNLAADVLWAQEFKNGLFAQGSGFVLGKEYGASLGFGLSGENLGIYVFGDSLYHQSLFFQIRPTIRLSFPWMSLTGSYALPMGKSTTKIGDEQVSAAKYLNGELNIIPVSWARVYGELMSVQNSHTRYRVGAEIRVLNWLSISADWNKSNSNLYSKWSGYEDTRFALNFSPNSKQPSSKPNQKIQMQPQYPILVAKKNDTIEPPKPPDKTEDIVEFMYVRTLPIINPNGSDPTTAMIWSYETNSGWNPESWTQTDPGKWRGRVKLSYRKSFYYIWTTDRKVKPVGAIATILFARIQGQQNWIELTSIEPNGYTTSGEWAKFILDKGIISVPSSSSFSK